MAAKLNPNDAEESEVIVVADGDENIAEMSESTLDDASDLLTRMADALEAAERPKGAGDIGDPLHITADEADAIMSGFHYAARGYCMNDGWRPSTYYESLKGYVASLRSTVAAQAAQIETLRSGTDARIRDAERAAFADGHCCGFTYARSTTVGDQRPADDLVELRDRHYPPLPISQTEVTKNG
jgi:hypothetical protein